MRSYEQKYGVAMNRSFWFTFAKRFIVCFLILGAVLSVFVTTQAKYKKNQTALIADVITYRIQKSLEYEAEKILILKKLILDKKDVILEAMHNKGEKAYFSEFVLSARMLYKNSGMLSLRLVSYDGVIYDYPSYSEEQSKYDKAALETFAAERFPHYEENYVVADYEDSLNGDGKNITMRSPVYYSDGKFWGFAAVTLKLPEFFNVLSLSRLTSRGFEYEVFVQKNKRYLMESTFSKPHKSALVISVPFYSEKLYFSFYPEKGWIEFEQVFPRYVFVFVLSLLIAYYMTKFSLSMIITKESLKNEQKAKEIALQAYKTADQANTAKSTFLSIMSHDIRTPMNAIMGFCTLLQMDYDKSEKVLDYAKQIHFSCQHLLGLINDVLDMSKIENGKMNLNLQPFQLTSVMHEVNIFIQPLAAEKKQNFRLEVEELVHDTVIGDKLRLNQILLNLLSNAVKYTPALGNISLKLREIPKESEKLSQFEFVVKDNGIGMSKEFISHIFEPFCRAVDGRIDKIQGTGLGMAITKNLVDLMGGTIEVESSENVGTVFTLVLEFRLQDRKEELDFLKRHHIRSLLILDGDESVYYQIGEQLEDQGIELHYAENFEKAKEILRNGEISMIMMEWEFKEGRGADFARELRENKFSMPILLFTACEWEEIEKEALAHGISGFLAKPFFLPSFRQAVENLFYSDSYNPLNKPLEGINVLAAEDNSVNAQILWHLLTKLGAACTLCEDGEKVTECFVRSEENEYDIILMDIQMPNLNGLEAAKRIRASSHKRAQTVPIVAMTANAFIEDVKASLASGMNAHISKPLQMKLLVNTIIKFSRKA